MFTIIAYIILGIIGLLLLFWIGKGLFSKPKKQKPPSTAENSWSNNAIRKQGEGGKGIR